MPICGATLHPVGITRLVVENLVCRNDNPLRVMEDDARIWHHQVRAVDDIPAYDDIVVRGFPPDCGTLALLDHVARCRVARGARRVQMNPYPRGSG